MRQNLVLVTGKRIGAHPVPLQGFKVCISGRAVVGIYVVIQIFPCHIHIHDFGYGRLLVGYPAIAVVVEILAPTVLAQPCARSGRTAVGTEIGYGEIVVPPDDRHDMVHQMQLACLIVRIRGRMIASPSRDAVGIVIVGHRQSAVLHHALLDGRDRRQHHRLIDFEQFCSVGTAQNRSLVDKLCVQQTCVAVESLALVTVHLRERIGVERQNPRVFGFRSQTHAVEDGICHVLPTAALQKGLLVVHAVLVKGTASVLYALAHREINQMRLGKVGRILFSIAVFDIIGFHRRHHAERPTARRTALIPHGRNRIIPPQIIRTRQCVRRRLNRRRSLLHCGVAVAVRIVRRNPCAVRLHLRLSERKRPWHFSLQCIHRKGETSQKHIYSHQRRLYSSVFHSFVSPFF